MKPTLSRGVDAEDETDLYEKLEHNELEIRLKEHRENSVTL